MNHLIQFPFLLPLVFDWLTDRDVMASLLVTGKSIKQSLTNYSLKYTVDFEFMYNFVGRPERDTLLPHQVAHIGDSQHEIALMAMHLEVYVRHTSLPFMWDLPLSLTHLTLTQLACWSSTCWIPMSVKNLKLASMPLEPIEVGMLPSSITHFTLCSKFDRALIPGVIPRSVTRFTTGEHIKFPLVCGSIPDSVTHLVFGLDYAGRVKRGVIPSSVTHLKFLNNKYRFVDWNVIPSSVTHLTVLGSTDHVDMKLLESLRYLKVADNILVGTQSYE